MKLSVVTLLHSGSHSDELTVYPSEDAAKDALFASTVKPSWDNAFCTDGTDCWVVGCTGVPASPDGLARDDAIELYFAHRTGTESYDLVNHEVELPAETAVTAFTDYLLAVDLAHREHILDRLATAGDDARTLTVELPGLFDDLFATSTVVAGDKPWPLHHAYHDNDVTRHGNGHSRRLTFRLKDTQSCCEALIESAEMYLMAEIATTESARRACRQLIGRCQLAITQARNAASVWDKD